MKLDLGGKNSQIPKKESRICQLQRLYQHLPWRISLEKVGGGNCIGDLLVPMFLVPKHYICFNNSFSKLEFVINLNDYR